MWVLAGFASMKTATPPTDRRTAYGANTDTEIHLWLRRRHFNHKDDVPVKSTCNLGRHVGNHCVTSLQLDDAA